jgi:hypothetical protein
MLLEVQHWMTNCGKEQMEVRMAVLGSTARKKGISFFRGF